MSTGTNSSRTTLAEQNRESLRKLNEEREQRRQWLEENAYLLDADIERRSAESIPDVVFKTNENALIEDASIVSADTVEPEQIEADVLTEEQINAIGDGMGMLRVDMRKEWRRDILESERDLIERFGARLQNIEAELKTLRTGPRAVKSDDSAA